MKPWMTDVSTVSDWLFLVFIIYILSYFNNQKKTGQGESCCRRLDIFA